MSLESSQQKAMDALQSIPRSIAESAGPTVKVFEPLLRAQAATIRATKIETFTYGNHERQKLDIYYPSQTRRPSISSASKPVVVFVHGGGFTRGSKTLEFADGLAHANIGSFFAERYGYTTIIPDYRLISHGARFPSGGEDIALVIEWVKNSLTHNDGYQDIQLFIVGK